MADARLEIRLDDGQVVDEATFKVGQTVDSIVEETKFLGKLYEGTGYLAVVIINDHELEVGRL